MRILQIDRKTNTVKLVPEIADDLWHLERVLEKGDLVSGATDRKIKPRAEGEKQQRVKLFLVIEAEKIDFNKETGNLRVTGLIRGGKPKELDAAATTPLGVSHSLEIVLGKNTKITKKELKDFQVKRLEKAQKATNQGKILLVVLDDEQADFALLKEFGLEKKGVIKSGKSGKMFESDKGGNYFKEIADRVKELRPEKTIFAGPGFAKENLKKWLNDRGEKGNFYFAATNSTGLTGLNELVKGNAIENIVKEMQLVKEIKLVEELLEELGKDSGLAEYGLEEVKKVVECGAVKDLLVCDSFLLENRIESEEIMGRTEQMKGKVHIIDAGNEAGKKLSSFGGIAALLRFKTR